MNDEFDNPLIFGKNSSENIVSIEINNDKAEIFTQDENGTIISNITPNKFWIVSAQNYDNEFKRLKGENHYKWGKQFNSLKSLYNFKNYYNDKDFFKISDPKESLMVLKGYTYYKGLKPQDIAILSFDIETTTLEHNNNAKLLLISNTFRKNGIITKKLFAFDEYPDEGEMIKDWCNWVRKMDPSILIGHNLNGFDIHYLKYIADKYDVDLNLGRNGAKIKVMDYGKPSKFRKDGSQDLHYYKSKIYGREIVDTMFLAIKHDIGRKYISYGLKQIIKQEGLEKANRTFYDASQIRHNYKNEQEWAKIKEYCKDDSDDALALFDLMAPAQFYLANSVPKSFQAITESATGSQLNSFLLRSYIQNAHSIPKKSEISPVKGGISFGIPGIYSNVIKIDLKSAYPSQVLRFKLYDPIKDPEANFYKMVHHFTYERFDLQKQYKETGDKYYYYREQAAKIVINSAYGLMNTPGLNFNNSDIANKITQETRSMIDLSLNWASGQNSDFYMKEEENEDSIII